MKKQVKDKYGRIGEWKKITNEFPPVGKLLIFYLVLHQKDGKTENIYRFGLGFTGINPQPNFLYCHDGSNIDLSRVLYWCEVIPPKYVHDE